MRSPGPGSNFLPWVLLDDWGGNTSETAGTGCELGIGLVLDLVLAAGGGLDSDATSSGDDDASESPLWLGYLIWLSHLRGDILENLLETDLRYKLYRFGTLYEIHVSGLPRYVYVPIAANLPFALLHFPFGSSSSLRRVTLLIHGSIHPRARMKLDMRTWTWRLL